MHEGGRVKPSWMRTVILVLFVAALLSACAGGPASSDDDVDGTNSSDDILLSGNSGQDVEATDDAEDEGVVENDADKDSSTDEDVGDEVSDVKIITTTIKAETNVAANYPRQVIKAVGGSGKYLWEVQGELPPGLKLKCFGTSCKAGTLKAKAVSITGKPTQQGSYPFSLMATDLKDDTFSSEQGFAINVAEGDMPMVIVGESPLGPDEATQGPMKIEIFGNKKNVAEVPLTSTMETVGSGATPGREAGEIEKVYQPIFRLKVTGGQAPYTWTEPTVWGSAEVTPMANDLSKVYVKVTKIFAALTDPDKDPESSFTVSVKDSANHWASISLKVRLVYPEQFIESFQVVGCRVHGFGSENCVEEEPDFGMSFLANDVEVASTAIFGGKSITTAPNQTSHRAKAIEQIKIKHALSMGMGGCDQDLRSIRVYSGFWEAAVYVEKGKELNGCADSSDIIPLMKGYKNDPRSIWHRVVTNLPKPPPKNEQDGPIGSQQVGAGDCNLTQEEIDKGVKCL